MTRRATFLSAAIAFIFFAGCSTDSMVQPQPIPVPAGLSPEQVGSAVSRALAGRGWAISTAAADSYDARLTGGDYRCDIRVDFDTRQVTIRYLSSQGLDYSPQTNTINRHWNWWMNYLNQDIRTQLADAAATP